MDDIKKAIINGHDRLKKNIYDSFTHDTFDIEKAESAYDKKVSKVMDEFKDGDLKSGGSGKKVTDRKQALAIALSEADKVKKDKDADDSDADENEDPDFGYGYKNMTDAQKAESDLFEKARNVGDVHPNGKWVWTQLPSGKFDWRTIKKRNVINSQKYNTERKRAEEQAYKEGQSEEQAKETGRQAEKELRESDKKTSDFENWSPKQLNMLIQKPVTRRHLEDMTDKELAYLRQGAVVLSTQSVSDLTKKRARQWAEEARKEEQQRRKEKNG